MSWACLVDSCLQTLPRAWKWNRMTAGKYTPQKQQFVSATTWCLQWSPLFPGKQNKRKERVNNTWEVPFHVGRHMMGLRLCAWDAGNNSTEWRHSAKERSGLRQKPPTFSRKGHRQCIFTVQWREIRKWPEPSGDQDYNGWVTGTQSQAQEVESELRFSVILSRQEWVRQTDIWGCSF